MIGIAMLIMFIKGLILISPILFLIVTLIVRLASVHINTQSEADKSEEKEYTRRGRRTEFEAKKRTKEMCIIGFYSLILTAFFIAIIWSYMSHIGGCFSPTTHMSCKSGFWGWLIFLK
jgi:magnesium-transporting ATPase (P-type)